MSRFSALCLFLMCLAAPLMVLSTASAQEPAPPAAAAPATTAPEAAPADSAAKPPVFNSGNIAWMLTSSALVLFMTAPGLAMFYGGLVRKKNVLSVLMQCVFLMGLMTCIWGIWGYSFSFSGTNPYFGNLDKAFLHGLTPNKDQPFFPSHCTYYIPH